MNDLLLLHGALGTKNQFKELEDKINQHFNVYSINLSGHGGETIPDGPFNNEMFACDVLNFINNSGLDKINIFGHSMGGYAGLYMAIYYPSRINKVFTIGTKLNWTDEFAAGEVKMLNPEKIKEKVPMFAEQLIKRHGADNWEALLGKVKEMMLNLGKGMKLTQQEFEKIEHEVWLGIGDMDKMVTLEETEAVCNYLKNGRVVLLPNTPHHYEIINTDVLAEEIVKFMQS